MEAGKDLVTIMAEASPEAAINPSPAVEEKASSKRGNNADAKEPIPEAIEDEKKGMRENELGMKIWKFVTWTPKRCRWDPEKPPKFNMALNLLFGFVSLTILYLRRGE